MICAREGKGFQKHSEVRPQSGHVYNYKALQRVAGEPAVLQNPFPTGSISFSYEYTKKAAHFHVRLCIKDPSRASGTPAD